MKTFAVWILLSLIVLAVIAQDLNKPDNSPSSDDNKTDSNNDNASKDIEQSINDVSKGVEQPNLNANSTDSNDDISDDDSQDSKEGDSNNNDTNDNSNDTSKDDSKDNPKDNPKDNSKDKKKPSSNTQAPFIRVDDPVYIESIKKSSISIGRPITFRWVYVGTPQIQPDSLTVTLEEQRDRIYTYVLATDLDPSQKTFFWDVTSYKPSNNDSETIVLKVGYTYKIFVHDSEIKYNTLYPKGRLKPGYKTFTFYPASDTSDPFGRASIIILSPFLSIILGLSLIYISL